jgi:hypothetical protein
MKIKMDFVTNSSSTSFIVAVHSDSNAIEEFVEKINQYMLDYIDKNNWKDDFEPPNLLTPEEVMMVSPGVFHIRGYIAYYGGDDDIPQYLEDLRNENGNTLSKYGIKTITFETKDLNKES